MRDLELFLWYWGWGRETKPKNNGKPHLCPYFKILWKLRLSFYDHFKVIKSTWHHYPFCLLWLKACLGCLMSCQLNLLPEVFWVTWEQQLKCRLAQSCCELACPSLIKEHSVQTITSRMRSRGYWEITVAMIICTARVLDVHVKNLRHPWFHPFSTFAAAFLPPHRGLRGVLVGWLQAHLLPVTWGMINQSPSTTADFDLFLIALTFIRSHHALYILPHSQRHRSHRVCPQKLPILLHLKSPSWSWHEYRARMVLCCHGASWRWTEAVPLWTVTISTPTTRTQVPLCPPSGRRLGKWRPSHYLWHALLHSLCLAANTTLRSGLRTSMDVLDPSVTPSPQMWSLPRAVKLEIFGAFKPVLLPRITPVLGGWSPAWNSLLNPLSAGLFRQLCSTLHAFGTKRKIKVSPAAREPVFFWISQVMGHLKILFSYFPFHDSCST